MREPEEMDARELAQMVGLNGYLNPIRVRYDALDALDAAIVRDGVIYHAVCATKKPKPQLLDGYARLWIAVKRNMKIKVVWL